ncbi:RidA family protein [Arenibaculum sp.]|uniref:RidA family protein n=1 Tax=Arenibaculum sp. TaxID=2865862 RepID=UPI002E150F81|nr:RidA family protein [Arenibaculum sp.]
MIRRVLSPEVPEPPPGLFSNCLVVGDTVYLSGLHAGVPGDDGMEEQTRRTLRKVRALVEAAGAAMADVVKLTIYVTDISRRAEVSAARREFFGGDLPCSTLVEVRALVDPGLLVEIDAVAVIGASRKEDREWTTTRT